MKRSISLFLALCLLLQGCGSRSTQEGVQARLYYMANDAENLSVDSAVLPETRTVHSSTLTDFLKLYFMGPESDTLRAPFPPGTEVLTLSQGENSLNLTMSQEFFSLSGVDLSIAACCLTNTLCDYTGVRAVVLEDASKRVHLELSAEDFLLKNDYTQDDNQKFLLYFSDSNHRYLRPEIRSAILSENESPEDYVLRQLMAGPTQEDLLPVVPENAVLLDAYTEGQVCYVDFSGAFYDAAPENDYEAYTTVYGIVNTLTDLEDVESVQFLRNGSPAEYYGIFPLGQPLSWEKNVAASGGTGGGELDVDIFVLSQEDHTPFAVPVRLQQTVSEPSAEAVAKAAITFDPPQGFYNPIPKGTYIRSISISGSVCYIDVSGDFVPLEDTAEAERAALWALVSALTGLDTISSVVLTIEGESGGLNYVNIADPIGKISLVD